MTQTLPESLIHSIKKFVEAHNQFRHEIEKLNALDAELQVCIDQLMARQNKLADISLTDKRPVSLPRAVIPSPREADGTS